MKVLLQRVSQASVTVDDQTIGSIGAGLLLLVGITHSDSVKDVEWMLQKVLNLRVFENEEGKAFDLSVMDAGKEILAVSQFTLYAGTQKGRRPDFQAAAPPEMASELYQLFVDRLAESGLNVQQGQFQAHMMVSLVNDGPITLEIESPT